MNWLNQELFSPCIAGIKYVDPFDNFRQKRTQSNDTLSMVCLRDKHPHNRKNASSATISIFCRDFGKKWRKLLSKISGPSGLLHSTQIQNCCRNFIQLAASIPTALLQSNLIRGTSSWKYFPESISRFLPPLYSVYQTPIHVCKSKGIKKLNSYVVIFPYDKCSCFVVVDLKICR